MHDPWLQRLGELLQPQESPPSWAQVHAARERYTARVRRKLARLLGVEATATDVDECPRQIQEDEQILARWRQSQGLTEDPGDVRGRIVQRLDDMARRGQVFGNPTQGDSAWLN